MTHEMGRRGFLKGSIASASGIAAGLGHEERILFTHLAQAPDKTPAPSPAGAAIPTGKIKDVTLSRLICGGNLIGGWAHSRDLIYVSKLFKAYNTETKIMETLQRCEENGINAILTNPISGPVIMRYWREAGGKIQWISECHPSPDDHKSSAQSVIDNGACMVYIQGAVGDHLLKDGHLDTIAQTVDFVRTSGVPAGVGTHSLEVVKACEKGGVNADFYVKTLHSGNYWSARRPDQTAEVIDDRHDNFWCIDPDATIEFMKTVEKPWIAFKVMAAGAITPNVGFRYAFENGADIVCAGMFDFQIAEDAAIARNILAEDLKRPRPWRA